MPLWLPGQTVCRHCGGVLQPGDDVLTLPPAWLPPWEPMHNFREAAFHRACWAVSPHRQRFTGCVNATNSGYRMEASGAWEFVGGALP